MLWTMEEISQTNAVARALRGMVNRANEVADGSKRAAILYGPTGIGKSHTVDEAITFLRLKNLDPVNSAPRNYHDLINDFEESEGVRPILMDEADTLFSSDKMINMLKIATDPRREPHERVYRGVRLTAPLFITTNVDLSPDGAITWSRPLRTHGPALFRRCSPRGIPHDRRALWQFSVALARYKRLIDAQVIEDGGKPRHTQSRPAARRAETLRWFTEQQDNLITVSPGTLKAAAEAFDYEDEIDREAELRPLLVPERRRKPPRLDRTDWSAEIKASQPSEAPPY